LLIRQRRAQITRMLRENGTVRVSELSRLFGVSEVTIRSDLRALEKSGILLRVYGGAVNNIGTGLDVAFAARAKINREAKQRIAAAAVAMIEDGDTIAIDAGTTTMEIARQLPSDLRITIVTTGPNIAMEAAAREKVTVDLAGGILSPAHIAVVGSDAEATIRSFYTKKAFLAILAFDLERGLMDTSRAVARVKRAFLENTEQAIVVADSTKFGKIAPVAVAPLSAVHTLITDTGLSDVDAERLREAGIEVIRV
ncbi:MAG TPA: DeoR/GlpR transcriptional regulator, partial [Anaerolineae bacterium]|nr:DeoR/GlpR transcriptional regulator [Anaerolineae bacterium]HIQ04711.1 DeoR/GlpR transcriptional regulator [Anaerolineae bacterium]